MQDHNLYHRIAAQFDSAGDRPFLMTPGREPLYYHELDKRCGQMHSRLKQLNVQPGDRVIVQVDKSAEAVLLYLACLRAGAIYIPLNTAYTTAELDYFIGDAKPALVVCRPTNLAELQSIAQQHGVAEIHTLDQQGKGSLLQDINTNTAPAIEPRAHDDLAAILYTSGTTGRSKGAMLTHDNLRSNAEALHSYWQWDDNKDVLLHALPIFHVHGLFVALHCALLGGSSVHFLPKFDSAQILDKLPESTVMMGVPTFYTRLLDEAGFDADVCQNMRLFISGSAPLLAETHQDFAQHSGHKILERYGMTEAGMITSNPYAGERVAGTVGYALPGVAVRVADDNGNLLASGETGVLEVRGPNIFKGYWQMPQKTAAEFRDDGWFITGDLATLNDTGRVTIVGRAKDLIISGGYNIYPKEIESYINEIDGVLESAVIGVPHKDFGEGVVAVVVLDGSQTLTEDDIIKPLQGQLARFKQPKRVYLLDELPRNTMGKVQKAQLRDTYQNTFMA
jgi:malonyl-CoA/methylmalonyl-CoA synthetase